MDVNKPARYLTGKTLDGGWLVRENVTKIIDGAGHGFAQSYIVDRAGEKAILKALDFSIALLDNDPTNALIRLSKSYDFEKELLELCQTQRLTRIINIKAKGNIPATEGSIIPVPYFVLEYTEKDVKSQIDLDSRLNTAWLLRILHNVTVGLFQLHKQGVAHKNVKPEHIADFGKRLQKITELGNSDRKGTENPMTDVAVGDDPSYITPEYLYGQVENDWIYKSQAADVYQLGNLIFFLFTQGSFNSFLFMWLDDLNPDYRPQKWGGTFKEVLPYLEEAYDKAIHYFTAFIEDDQLKKDFETILRQLCHPDPTRRGHPKDISSIGSSMSLERFISHFNRMAILAEQKVK